MTVDGRIEYIQTNEIGGWAFDHSKPQVHLTVTVSFDGSAIASGPADMFRGDLARAGIGKGDHGFRLKLHPPLSADALKRLQISAGGGETKAVLLPPRNSLTDQALSAVWISRFPLCRDPTQRPVFVLGPARSGTTAVSSALMNTRTFRGFGEGHLLDLIGPLMRAVLDYYREHAHALQRGTMLREVPPDYFIAGIQAQFVSLMASLYGGKRWLDKTPSHEFIALAPVFRNIWPNARFIFMKRRGIENVTSRQRKFPNVRFIDQCADWAKGMENWLAVRDVLGEAAIELEQMRLAREPEQVSWEIARHVDLPEEDFLMLKEELAFARPERTKDELEKPLALESVGWTDQQIEIFGQVCGPVMKLYGYSYDASYWSNLGGE